MASLRTSYTALEDRLNESLTKVSQLTTQLADSEASFRAEISTSQRLTDLLEKREEDTKKRLEQVEREWEAAKADIEAAKSEYEQEIAAERQRGDALEARVQEMRDFADNLAAGGGANVSGILSIAESEDVFGGTPRSPSAATLAMKLQKSGGKSYTEIYTSYVKMQEELTLERAESKRLGECLNAILAEIQERAPMLREQRAEYERAIQENNEISVALARALDERDEAARSAEEQRLRLEQHSRESAIAMQQLEDTSKQVRTLTRRIAILEDPSIVDRSADTDEQMNGTNAGQGDAEAYISTHLVTFASIDQLQQQNQKLLKVTRELARKMEAEEQALRERLGQAENEAVEEAHELILRLKEEVETQRVSMGAYQRERDMLRQLLRNRSDVLTEDGQVNGASGTSASSATQAALDDVQRNFEAYKREMVVDNQLLRDDLGAARREASQLQVDLARANAQKELSDERYRMLSDTNSRQAKEIKDTSRRNVDLQTNMARQEEATRRVTDELLELKGSLDRVKHESMMLKAEKEVWKVTCQTQFTVTKLTSDPECRGAPDRRQCQSGEGAVASKRSYAEPSVNAQ